MKSDKPRPVFRAVKSATGYDSPEALFYKLSRREKTHGYLRGPQQDVLREYAEKHGASSNVAFELPTGTGKTAVGLLILEWKRLQANKVAYLSLTNQLAGQVLMEAERLGISCADLRGTKVTRDRAEEGRYKTAGAIAVTTYSNLFNINPVMQDCDLFVFDDAHGAEQYVTDMWTVTVSRKDKALFGSLLAALKPALSESQIRVILDKTAFGNVEMADVRGHPECIPDIIDVLDNATADSAKFAWKLIRQNVTSCLFLVSPNEICVRPLIPPTHTHPPFALANQRIYMSATMGGESDLQRAYGIEKLHIVRAKSPQWGRRYVFVPGLHTGESEAASIVASVWDGMKKRRAVLLAPSERIVSRTFDLLEAAMNSKPARLGAPDIENTMDQFINRTDVILGLSRYDGLDLPDEQCRLLVLSESPAAINQLERHLSERWKMGPVLRKRERTRLIQGMGRCTRNATDFAVIVWMGQSLVNASTSSSLLNGFPPELRAELTWGVQQSQLAAGSSGELVSMILGLIDDADYRKAADADIEGIAGRKPEKRPKDYEEAGADEVRYSKAMWDDDFACALETAHAIADQLNSPELAGYRAWWWYLGSIAAELTGDRNAEQDALRRGARCGVNSGWLNQLLRQRKAAIEEKEAHVEPNAEPIWDLLVRWGWAGPCFEQKIGKMLDQLKDDQHTAYHQGLETLGECFGARTTRSTEHGAPDVVWTFSTDVHIAFEAKTEKGPGGTLSKKDIQEAKGHADWIRAHLCQDRALLNVSTVVVAPSPVLHRIAGPFAEGLFYVGPQSVLRLAEKVADNLRELRVKFSGRDFAETAIAFSAEIRGKSLTLESARVAFASEPLKMT